MTGVGAAVGVLLIGRQGRTMIGIRDPEEYFSPTEFLDQLKTYPGIRLSEEVVWDPDTTEGADLPADTGPRPA